MNEEEYMATSSTFEFFAFSEAKLRSVDRIEVGTLAQARKEGVEVTLAHSGRLVVRPDRGGVITSGLVRIGSWSVRVVGFAQVQEIIHCIENLQGVRFQCFEREGQRRRWLHPRVHEDALKRDLLELSYPGDVA